MLAKVVVLIPALLFSMTTFADVVQLGAGDFLPGSEFVDFETGSTAPPDIPGITFVHEGDPSSPPWFNGQCSFSSAFFGNQLYANTVSVSLSELAIEFSPPLHAVGAWIGHIPNLIDQHADPVLFRILDSSGTLIWDSELDLPDVGQPPIFCGIRSDTMIGRVEWRGNDTGVFAIDNLLAGDAVPEPSMLFLLFVPLAAVTRRR
ncbi:MAG: hypothetical protein PVJ57_22545 [Phycisphaerae bacterium]|jgi:hypothetical protein